MGNRNCFFVRHDKVNETMYNHDNNPSFCSVKRERSYSEASVVSSTETLSHLLKMNTTHEVDEASDTDQADDGDGEMSLDFSQDLQSISEEEAYRHAMTTDPYEYTDTWRSQASFLMEKHQRAAAAAATAVTAHVPTLQQQQGRRQLCMTPIAARESHLLAPHIDETIERYLQDGKKSTGALTNRLEKARNIQMVLSTLSSSSQPLHNSDDLSTGVYRVDPSENEDEEDSTKSSSALEVGKHQLCMDFEDTVSTGVIWAEMSCQDKVTAVTMSRTRLELAKNSGVTAADVASIDSTPSARLLLAVGTENGTVVVADVADNNSFAPSSPGSLTGITDNKAGNIRKLVEISRKRRIRSLDFSPDGQFLVVAGDDCIASIYRLGPPRNNEEGGSQEKGGIELTLVNEIERVDRIYAVQFSPDAELLAIGGFDGTMIIVSVKETTTLPPTQTPRPIKEIIRDALILCIDWSPNGKYLAVGGSDKMCAVLETSSWQLIGEINRSTSIQTIRWNPGGTVLAVGDQEVAIANQHNLSITKEITTRSLSEDSRPASSRCMYRISSVCWSPNGKYLVVCGSDNCCVIFETKTFSSVHELRRSCCVTCMAWGELKRITGDCIRYLAVGDEDGRVAILKAGVEEADINSSASEYDDLSSSASSSYFSTESDWVLQEGAFRDLEDTPTLAETEMTSEGQGNITSVAFSRGSKAKPSVYLAYATDDNSVTIRKSAGWTIVKHLKFAKSIRTMMFSNGSKFLALGGDDGIIYIFSASDWSVVAEQTVNSCILSLSFSKNNERLAVGTSDGLLALFDPTSGWDRIGDIDNIDSSVTAVDWSSHDIAVGREDGTVTVHDTDKVFSNFFVPNAELSRKHPVRSVAFGVSGRFLAIGGNDGMVGVYSSKGGWVLCHQITIGYNITGVKWSPTGRYLGFTGENKTLRIVDTIFWAELDEVTMVASSIDQSKNSAFSSLAFSQNGRLAVFGGLGAYVLDTNNWTLLLPTHHLTQNEDKAEVSSIIQDHGIGPKVPASCLE